MADQVFVAIDGLGAPVNFLAWSASLGEPIAPYRKFTPGDLAAITTPMTNILAAVNNPSPPAVTPTNRNNAIAAAVAEDVFPGGNNVWTRFRNIGPNDAVYMVGNDAGTGFVGGDKQINVGESVTLPYKTSARISFFSSNGTNIEGEEWA